MEAILQDERLVEFCVNPWLPFPNRPLERVSSESSSDLRTQIRKNAPRLPGVYGMIDAIGRLIYVGKSKLLRNRLLSYFLPNSEDEKSGRIIQSVVEIVWETQPSEFAALLREQSLIRFYEPRYNVQGQPKRQRPAFLCLGHAPAEHFYVTRFFDPAARISIGPLSGSIRVHRAVEILNRIYHLRDCSNQTKFSFSDQLPLFQVDRRPHCFRHEIGNCLGPCVEACSRQSYEKQVREGHAFLQGDSTSAVESLKTLMNIAAKGQHFERAGRLHEDVKTLQWIENRIEDFSSSRTKYNFVYPVEGCEGRNVCYVIRRGALVGALGFSTSQAQWQKSRQELVRLSSMSDSNFVKNGPENETFAVILAWFRKNTEERKRAFSFDQIPPSVHDLVRSIQPAG